MEDWLKEQFEYYEAAPSTIRSYVKELREQYGIPKVMTYRHYEPVPELPMGKQMQVDFGEIKVQKSLKGQYIKHHSWYISVAEVKQWVNKPIQEIIN